MGWCLLMDGQVAVRSCRRQFDNLRRAYYYIEEQKQFQVMTDQQGSA